MAEPALAVALREEAPPLRGRTSSGWLVRGVVIAWIVLLVALPLGLLVLDGLSAGPAVILEAILAPTAWDALWLTLWTAGATSVINAIMGTATAWVLVRYTFPGRALLSGLVDLPFAIPTLVTGLMIIQLCGPQTALGGWLEAHGLGIAFTPVGIVLALQFINLPFVVRATEPLLRDLERAEEEAAWTLGAGLWTVMVRVLLPPLVPAIAGGTLQGFARCLAEFGSVVVVSGNIPGSTLTAPVYVFGEVEAGRVDAAIAVSMVMLALALFLQPCVRALYKAAGLSDV